DRLLTFRKHLFWAGVSAVSIATAVGLGHVYPANMVWASLSLFTCLIPVGLWSFEPVLAPRRAVAPNPLPAAHVPRPRTEIAGSTGPAPFDGDTVITPRPVLPAAGAGERDTVLIARPERPRVGTGPAGTTRVGPDQDTVRIAAPSQVRAGSPPAR